ncbi:DinI-like family protein [Orbus mooreae]|uniref:DinI-like family protein n=1 Tax=Orbus mooreae TaxID=3074107 RepID=UPI00370DC6F1
MLKIDILLSKDEKATQAIADALQIQIEKKLSPLYSDLFVRVRVGTGKKCDISGIKDKNERARIDEMLEDIFFSDDWLPEQKFDDTAEVVMAPKQLAKRPNLSRR